MKRYKVLYCDLDGTLIKTKSGETFPKGIWDMEFRFEVLNAIKELKPDYVLVVSNQEGIQEGFVNARAFRSKSEYISYSVEEYCKCRCISAFCCVNDPNNKDRLPNTGMLKYLSAIQRGGYFDKTEALMIGDASSKKTAENFGIDFMGVEDFVEQYK